MIWALYAIAGVLLAARADIARRDKLKCEFSNLTHEPMDGEDS